MSAQQVFFARSGRPRLAAFVAWVFVVAAAVLGLAWVGGWIAVAGIAVVLAATVTLTIHIDAGAAGGTNRA